MGRTLEEILTQEDKHMIADARSLATEMLLDIEKVECVNLDEAAVKESQHQQETTDTN